MMAKVPAIEMPKRAKGQKVMKGRPITGEEFDRLLAAIPKVVLWKQRKCRESGQPKPLTPAKMANQGAIVASWDFYLRGLWSSGLRLAESLDLFWDRDDRLCIDLTGKRPTLRIPAALEKGNTDRMLPISPEFAEFLEAVPRNRRTGRVFAPLSRRGNGQYICTENVCATISAIGKAAGVKVNTDKAGKVKYASAHDLRRSFGERWASKVMPQVLMELMRHAEIATTMRFYVGRNAQATAEILWQAHSGNTFGNSDQKSTSATTAENQRNALSHKD